MLFVPEAAALGRRTIAHSKFGDKSQNAIECEAFSLSRMYFYKENSLRLCLVFH